MSNRLREYQRPTDLTAALSLLRRADVQSAPVVLGPRPAADPYQEVEAAIDLSALGLSYITESEDAIHIGGLTSLQDLADSPLVCGLANGMLAEAARLAAHLNLRQVATLTGALARPENPAEIRLVLSALNAQVVVQGTARLEFPVSTWQKPLRAEIAVEVRIPRPSLHLSGGLARVARTPLDSAIVAAAAVIESEAGLIRQARIQVGPSPRCGETVAATSPEGLASSGLVQSVLERLEVDKELVSDYRGGAGYRRAMAGVLARRALTQALHRMTAAREA